MDYNSTMLELTEFVAECYTINYINKNSLRETKLYFNVSNIYIFYNSIKYIPFYMILKKRFTWGMGGGVGDIIHFICFFLIPRKLYLSYGESMRKKRNLGSIGRKRSLYICA